MATRRHFCLVTSPADQLSPRQRECLQLVWDRQATSKEIAIALGISKSTVDGYIAEAVEQLGARDRREAAAMAFGDVPRAASGGDPARVSEARQPTAGVPPSMEVSAMSRPRPWPSPHRPRNALTLTQTLGWIATIAIGSLVALALATSVGNGLPSVARPVIDAVHRLTR